jgi:hypothetical protein
MEEEERGNGMQEEAEDRAAAAERRSLQALASLKQAGVEAQQAAADAQLDGHSATLRLSMLQQSYSGLAVPLHHSSWQPLPCIQMEVQMLAVVSLCTASCGLVLRAPVS